MKSFRQYVEQQVRIGHVKKKEILEMWRELNAGPINMMAVPAGHKGTRFRSDGIRITGTPQFINSVIARFKDLIAYETTTGTRLDVEYRQIEAKGTDPNSMPAYVFYVYVEQAPKKVLKYSRPGEKIKYIPPILPA